MFVRYGAKIQTFFGKAKKKGKNLKKRAELFKIIWKASFEREYLRRSQRYEIKMKVPNNWAKRYPQRMGYGEKATEKSHGELVVLNDLYR